MRKDHVLPHVLRVGAGVADALDPLDGIDVRQQTRERHPLGGRLASRDCRDREIAAVGVDVLAKKRHLAYAFARHRAHLLHQLERWAADLAAAGGGNDAVGARAVASHADLKPALERARAAGRQAPGETLELEVALGRNRLAGEELREPVHLAWPKGDVDEREAREHLLLER